MVARINIDDFSKGEDLAFPVYMRNKDETVILNAASQQIDFVIVDLLTRAIVVEFNSSPQVVLADAGTGDWTITLSRVDLASLNHTDEYEYNVFSTSNNGAGERLHQLIGLFTLDRSGEPT